MDWFSKIQKIFVCVGLVDVLPFNFPDWKKINIGETPRYHSAVMFKGFHHWPPWCQETILSRTAVRLIVVGTAQVNNNGAHEYFLMNILQYLLLFCHSIVFLNFFHMEKISFSIFFSLLILCLFWQDVVEGKKTEPSHPGMWTDYSNIYYYYLLLLVNRTTAIGCPGEWPILIFFIFNYLHLFFLSFQV